MSGSQRKFTIRQLSQQFWMFGSHLVGETGRADRELEIQVKLGHEISFLTGTLLHGVKGSSSDAQLGWVGAAVMITVMPVLW